MANLLAIESSAAVCSIALGINGQLSVREQEGVRSHTQFMLAFIDEVLQEQQCAIADLDGIVFAAGPASFTGVRLAASVAKSLAYAVNIPVIPVSSLAAIAQTAARSTASLEPCLVITDARMGEVYMAEYGFDANGIAYALQNDALAKLDGLTLPPCSARRIAGDAQALLQGREGLAEFEWVAQGASAQDLLRLGEQALKAGKAETALSAQAIYLRDKTSWKNTTQQREEKQHSRK